MRKSMIGLAALMLIAGSVGQAQASIMLGFAGNTQPYETAGSGVRGLVNFAVFNRDGGAGDQYNTGILGLDSSLWGGALSSTSNYLYLYQTIVTLTDISRNTVAVSSALVSSSGVLGPSLGLRYGFEDSAGQATHLNPFGFPTATPANTSGYKNGVVVPLSGSVLKLYTGLIAPAVSTQLSNVRATFDPEILPNAISVVWGFTSPWGPTYGNTAIIDGASANGTVPVPIIPEASSLIAWIGLGLCFGGYRWRRNKA